MLCPTRSEPDFSSPNPTRARIFFYPPVRTRFKTEIKNITLNFEKFLIKRKWVLPVDPHSTQSHQLRTATFLCSQERGISIFFRRPARLKHDSFSKSKPEPDRKARSGLTTFITRKRSKRYDELALELTAIRISHQDGGIPLSTFPTAQEETCGLVLYTVR